DQSGLESGKRYEYKIVDNYLPTVQPVVVSAAISGNPIHDRGRLLLVIENENGNGLYTLLGTALDNFRKDLAADGWNVTVQSTPAIVKRHIDGAWTSANGDNAITLKNYIVAQASGLKAIVLLGHITVPYAGTEASDGHNQPVNNHAIAWAADAFYGDVDSA